MPYYTPNNFNRYTRITVDGAADMPGYDANGNLTHAQGVDYRYNARNQLIEVTTATERMTQIHDPKGRVIERRYFTKASQGQWIEDDVRSLRLVYDTAWNVIEDRSTGGQLRARYIHGPRIDEILLREGNDGAKLYPLADGLGSTVALTDANGGITQRYRYDAYGTPTVLKADYSLPAAQSSLLQRHRFLFTGREWLGIAGLQDNRKRAYSATLSRWLSIDPIGFQDGANLYIYSKNSPIYFTDPSGLICLLGYFADGYIGSNSSCNGGAGQNFVCAVAGRVSVRHNLPADLAYAKSVAYSQMAAAIVNCDATAFDIGCGNLEVAYIMYY